MAAYREHITVSGTLGIAYAFAAKFALGFTVTQSLVAAVFTWIAGMLPDLDAENGRPVRELFALSAVLAPVVLVQHASELGISGDRVMLFALLTYGAIRYGGAALLGRITVHRGMFHSIPALIISSELMFLGYHSSNVRVRLLMACGVAIGFISHLVLDELYSVQWNGVRIRLKKSAGSALKFFGKDSLANGVAVGLMLFLTWATLNSVDVVPDLHTERAPEMIDITSELPDAPEYRMADEPNGTVFR